MDCQCSSPACTYAWMYVWYGSGASTGKWSVCGCVDARHQCSKPWNLDTAITAMSALMIVMLVPSGRYWVGAIIPWSFIEIPSGELAAPTNDINVTTFLAL